MRYERCERVRRLDSIFGGFLAFYPLSSAHTSYTVRPLNDSILPPQTYIMAATGPTPESPHGTLLDKLGPSLVSPVIAASAILQLCFNHRLRSFAAGYKVCGNTAA